ncbi:MAG: response regulator [Candidatus Latescibacterota bacterium]
MQTNKEVLTTFEAAEYCHTSYMSVKRWIWSGKLKAFKTPGGHFRIQKNDLVEFMRKNDIPVPEDIPVVRKKMLIVDDDELVREGVANYLRMNSSDLEIATAEDGYEAGMMVTNFKPDLILLDLMMPRMDGFAVCEKLKKSPLTRNIKIIVLTGFGNEENTERAYACGADRVLAKPVEMEELFEYIIDLM